MATIVLNTLTGAVSEYGWAFQSLTPSHAGDATGLYQFGGDLDDTLPIASSITTGKTLCGSSVKKRIPMVYLSIRGLGNGLLRVFGEVLDWSYGFVLRASGQSRAQPGKGIRENYLAFGYQNVDGADFTLDRIEVDLVPSANRRTGS